MALTLILERSEGSILFFSCLSSGSESVAHGVVFWVGFRDILGFCDNKNLLFAWNRTLVIESVASHLLLTAVLAAVCVCGGWGHTHTQTSISRAGTE
jgi:hypothetical protein